MFKNLQGTDSLSIPNSKLHVSKSNPNLNNDTVMNILINGQQPQQQNNQLQQQTSISSDEFRIKTTFYQAAKTSIILN